jgi:hypothetical protein
MPRRRGKRRNKRANPKTGNRDNFDKTTSCAFRAFFNGPVSNGVTPEFSTTNIIPTNLGARITALASQFEYWKLKDLHISQVLCNLVNSAQTHYLAFIPVPPAYFVPATTIAQMVDFPHFGFNSALTPTRINLSMNSKALSTFSSNRSQWLTTDATGITDTLFYSAGTITSAIQGGNSGDTSSFVRYLITGTALFRAPLDPALSLRFVTPIRAEGKVDPSGNVYRTFEYFGDKKEESKT